DIINGHKVNYSESDETFYVDGRRVPSISEICMEEIKDWSLPNATFSLESIEGNQRLSELIEVYESTGTVDSNSPELIKYIEVKKEFGITKKYEPHFVLLEVEGRVVIGDMVSSLVMIDNQLVLMIVQRESFVTDEFMKLHFNLSALGIKQTYNQDIHKLMFVKLFGETIDVAEFEVNYEASIQILKKYIK